MSECPVSVETIFGTSVRRTRPVGVAGSCPIDSGPNHCALEGDEEQECPVDDGDIIGEHVRESSQSFISHQIVDTRVSHDFVDTGPEVRNELLISLLLVNWCAHHEAYVS
jgi:hypothetical protein